MLLVLALVWGTFLVWWLHSRAQGTFGDSIGTFRRHLTVLERTAPSTVRPANRLRGATQMLPAYRPHAAVAGVPGGARRLQGPAGQRPSVNEAQRRRATLRRRRDVLFILTIAVVATLVMAVATRTSAIIVVQLLADVSMLTYLGLLVRMRNLSAERDLKLTYLARERTSRRAGSGDLRHAEPGGYAEDGYEPGFYGAALSGAAGYGPTGYGAASYGAADPRTAGHGAGGYGAAGHGAAGYGAAGYGAAGPRAGGSGAPGRRGAGQGQRPTARRAAGFAVAGPPGVRQGQRAAGRSAVARSRAVAHGAAGYGAVAQGRGRGHGELALRRAAN